MPIPVSPEILEAKRRGKRANLIRIDLASPLYYTDGGIDVVHDTKNYESNGLLLDVDPGAITAGISADEWKVTISTVPPSVYSVILAGDFINRWVYHYVAYFSEDENGLSVVGVESRKFGRIIRADDFDDESTGEVTLVVSSPLGYLARKKPFLTNPSSQYGRFGADDIFRFAHETDLKIPARGSTGTGAGSGGSGDKTSDLPTAQD